MVSLLLKHGANANEKRDDCKETPLHVAARWGHLKAVRVLLKNGAKGKSASPLFPSFLGF